MNRITRAAYGAGLVGVFVAAIAAPSCAAPDAIPGPDVIKPDGGGSGGDGGSGGTGGTGGSGGTVEPIAGDPVWGGGFGDSTNDQKLFDVALEPSTNSIVMSMGYISAINVPGLNGGMPYLAGSTTGTMPSTVQNILVVKSDLASGNATWATAIHNAAEIVRSTVDIDKDGNIIVAGGFAATLEVADQPPVPTLGSYDAFVAKYDSTGKSLWVHTFGSDKEEYVTDVATDDKGNIIVVGFAASANVDFGNGPQPTLTSHDIFVAKYDPDFKFVWAMRAGAAGATDLTGKFNWREPTATVEVSRTDGSIIIGGSYSDALSFPPFEIPKLGGEDGFVAKLDAAGKGVWHFEFGGASGKQRVRSLAFGLSGDVFFTGALQGNVVIGTDNPKSYKGTQDLLIAKCNDADVMNHVAKPAWLKTYGGLGDQVGTKVIVDEKGRFFVGGSFTGSIDFSNSDTLINTTKEMPYTPTDIFVSKFSETGKPLWAHSFGDANPNALVGIQTIEGGVLWKNDKAESFVTFGGINSGSIDFGGALAPLQSLGYEDAYLMTITY